MPTVWFTKYALAKGVITRECEVNEGSDRISVGKWTRDDPFISGTLGVNAFLTEADAHAAVGRMIARKIAAVEKQLARLRKLAEGYPRVEAAGKRRGGKRSA